ncbi:caspase family protein [Hyalangium gracile]|uniref:caspase family protein n=1 Tax=Hyalangium gracile TaxID=394092 RepID=UPI001CCDC5CF|nr:caspase family protein [Hyalangium gracile]
MVRLPTAALLALALTLTACLASSGGEKGGLVRVRADADAVGSAHAGERHALLIGIPRFSDEAWTPLRYAGKDAEDLARALRDPSRGGFASVTVLTRPEETTRAALLDALRALQARVRRPQDVVVVYVSSHGTLARDVRGELQRYLVTSDTSFRDVAGTSLDMPTLEASLEQLRSLRRVLVLATCHSGTGKSLLPPEVRAELERTKGPTPAPTRPLEESSRASIILSASDWGEAAREDDALGNDIYTHFLVQALDGRGDRNGDGAVSATEAHDFARRLTYAYTQGRQRPSARILEVGADPALLSGRLSRAGRPELFSYGGRLEGFTLKVDGEDVGQLPGGVAVPPGRRKLELTKGGQVLWADTLELVAGERRDLEALAQRPSGAGARPRAVSLAAGGFSFLDTASRQQVLPASALLGTMLYLPQALLDERLDLWVDVAAGMGQGQVTSPVGKQVQMRHRALVAGASVGKSWWLGPVGLSTGPHVAALWLQRSFQLELVQGDSYATLWPGWMAGVTWRATPRFTVTARSQFLWAYVPVDGRTRMVGFGIATLGGGYRF